MKYQHLCLGVLLALSLATPHAALASLPVTIDLALATPSATLQGGYPLGWAGNSVCIADINGDNWPDIVVASCLAEPMGGLRAGELTIVWGGYPGLSGNVPLSSGTSAAHVFGPTDGDPVYCNVAAGDFNDDGFDDILWGHPGSPSPEWFGKVYLIPGGNAFPELIDLENPPATIIEITGHDYLGLLGYGLASADFNGDGVDDIVLSASGMLYSEVYVISGSPCLLPAYWTGGNVPGMTRIIDVDPHRGLGRSIAASDVDRDGKDDLVLGAPEHDGQVIILHGAIGLGDSVLITNTNLRSKLIMPEFLDGQLGQDVAIGDVDNDGELDVAVSAVSADPMGCSGCGAAYIIKNVADMPDTLWLQATAHPVTRLFGSGVSTYYGLHLRFGDIDGDDRDDLIVSNWPFQENQRARTVIAFASALTLSTHMLASDPSFTRIIEKKIGDRLGSSLASADLNRDGLDDLLIGALAADPPSMGNAGEVYLINGCYVPSAVQPPSGSAAVVRNFPNPFSGNTVIDVKLLSAGRIRRVAIYDVRGEYVADLPVPSVFDSRYSVPWSGRDANGRLVASGFYFVRLETPKQTVTKKMLLIR